MKNNTTGVRARPMETIRMAKRGLVGSWRIVKMSEWEQDYCDEEGPAFIRITSGGGGEFRFGLVSGDIDGGFKKTCDGVIFDFTWEGTDELDEASGDGWARAVGSGKAEGEIRFHRGDSSKFWASKRKTEKG